MTSLWAAQNIRPLDWYLLSYPMFDGLREREDFRVLEGEINAHVNAERAKLGWPPV